MREVYENGRGSIKVRARYNVVPGENMLEITQIPPTTTVEAIMDKIAELVKAGKIKEISDMRDETDLNGLKLTLDLKRGVDPEKLMAKLYKTTPLEDSFSCNFNVLVSGQPRVMGVREILQEWTAFRMECVRRRTYYDLHGKEKRLHLLKGLAAILLDIDKAIHIIRTTEEETEVVPNLMIGFGIDEVQADYVAEIRLRHLNREYILKRTGEIEQLEKDIADLNDILAKPARIRRIIINELNDVAKKYAQPRRSEILYDLPEEESGAEEESIPDYPVTVFFTREGYLKKIPPQSLRTAGAHKLKEGDEIIHQVETRNNVEALFFTDKQQVYKVRLNELEDGKVAQMASTCRAVWEWMRARISSLWSSRAITAVMSSSSLRAASAQRSRWPLTPPSRTAASCSRPIPTRSRWQSCSSCPRTRSWPSAPAQAGCCWSTRRRSLPRPPATARVLLL